jgi:hypothetical protein
MSTVIPFLPSNLVQPTFIGTFDSDQYRVTVSWNVAAQRYYINIYGQDGTWIVTVPLVQTPPARPVASVVYDNLRRVVTVKMIDPSQWPVPLYSAEVLTPPGIIVDYTLENFDPPVLNAKWRSLHVDPITFSFPLANDPGQVHILGSVSRMIDMVEGVFVTTRMIYRNGAFEINP